MGFEQPSLIIGHRGAAGLAPENTLQSFAAAYAWGVQAVELDLYCVEGQLVVFHDDRLDRTTNGEGPIQRRSLAYLRSLDAGAGQQIPLLSEVWATLPDHVGINLELKGRSTAQPLADFLAHQPAKEVLVSSFRHAELARFKDLAPQWPVAPLLHRWPPAPWAIAERLNAYAINLSARITTAKRVAKIHRGGYRCYVYTVNQVGDAQALFAMGVDGIFTDRPDRFAD